MDYALHRGRGPWLIEKWYVDTLMPDGSVLIVLLAGIRFAGLWLGRVAADLYRSDGSAVRGHAGAPHVAGDEGQLVFGPARIVGDRMSWHTRGLSGDLEWAPRAAPVTVRDPLLSDGRRRLDWTVEIPDADVEGNLRWPGGTLRVRGRGYRDRVWTDYPPARIGLRVLRWGRAVSETHAAFWIDAETPAERIRAGWADGEWTVAPPADLAAGRTLVDGPVADLGSLGLGALRPLLRRLSRDPTQTRWLSPATLQGSTGWAVHEEVRWR